jgi:hypothetical protein
MISIKTPQRAPRRMDGVRLRYRKATFLPMLALLGLALLFLNAFFAITVFKDLASQLTAALVSVAVFLVLGVSPLLTSHSLDEKGLELRQGWYFRARIPSTNIRSISMVDKGPVRTGVFFRLTGGSLFVTTQRRDIFRISLRSPQRFGFALGKRADEVYFDTMDRELMLRKLKERGIIPSNPGR